FVRKVGEARLLELFLEAYARERQKTWPEPQHVSTPLSSSIATILASAPEGGWGSGVRPQRVPGYAMVTVHVPLGDVDADDLRVHISGCPNSCAQHQIADVGFSGGKVTIAGSTMLGYHVWLGGDLRTSRMAQIVGRVSGSDVPAILSAVAGVWEALRERGETLSDTVARYGLEAFQAQIAAVFRGRWEPGPEPAITLASP